MDGSPNFLFFTFQLLPSCILFPLHILKFLIALVVVLFLAGKLKFWLMVEVVKFGNKDFCEDKKKTMIEWSNLWIALVRDKKMENIFPGKEAVNLSILLSGNKILKNILTIVLCITESNSSRSLMNSTCKSRGWIYMLLNNALLLSEPEIQVVMLSKSKR